MTTLQEGVEALRGTFRGTVALPGEAGFEAGTKTWAKTPLKVSTSQPAVVLTPRGTADVVAALKFAQGQGLEVAVRSGGHCPRGSCVPEGGAVIDLSLMRGVFVDPVQRTVVAEGGCLLGDIDAETALHNLMVPLGHAPVTGMGLVLNGGFGVGSKTFGATCDHVVAVQMVTADGQVVTVDAKHHPDLFWAIKGAGSAFGVVTKITFRLHDVGAGFCGGTFFWPDDPEHANFVAIAKFIRDEGIVNPNFSSNLLRVVHPEMGPLLIAMVMYFGDESAEQKAAFLEPLRALGPVKDTVGQDSYVDVQNALMPLFGHAPPHYEYWVSAQLTRAQATDDVLKKYAAAVFDKVPLDKLPLTMFLYDSFHGEPVRSSTAPIGVAQAEIFFALVVGWLDEANNSAGLEFAKYLKETMAGFKADTNTYSNMVSGIEEHNGGAETALAARVGGKANLARLRELKKQWDGNNVFVNTPFKNM